MSRTASQPGPDAEICAVGTHRLDLDLEAPVPFPQRRIHLGPGRSLGEEEAEVTVAVGQRLDAMAGADGDVDARTNRTSRATFLRPPTETSIPDRGIGSIITPDAPSRLVVSSSPTRPRAWARTISSRVTPVEKRSRGGAAPADRAGRDLDQHGPPGRSLERGEPYLGVHRFLDESDRPGRVRDEVRDGDFRASAPRDEGREVDGLLEKGAVKRVGLVEEGQDLQVA